MSVLSANKKQAKCEEELKLGSLMDTWRRMFRKGYLLEL